MKIFNLSLLFILISTLVNAQTLNQSFENWQVDTNQIAVSGEITFFDTQAQYEIDDPEFSYPSPSSWSSVSQITGTESMTFDGTNNSDVILVNQSSDAQHLLSSVQIETRRINIEAEVTAFGNTNTQTFTNQAPGLLVSGEFDIDFEEFADEILIGGSLNSLNPFTFPNTGHAIDFAPNTLKGFYKYNGVNGDSALIFTGVIKDRIIVAYGISRLPNTTSFSPFTIQYNYLSCETPDTIITVISSSNLDVTFGNDEFSINSNYTGEDGSVLLLDNLTMDTFDFDNFPPILADDNFTVVSSVATELDVTINDFSCGEGDLVPIIFESPENGSVVVLNNNFLEYTSNIDYDGNDTLSYYICSSGVCDTAQVFIQVNPVPECQAVDVTRTMESNTVDVFSATENDINCGAIPILFTEPQNGLASVLANGDISYSPNNDYIGVDEFDYYVCSDININQCDTATIKYTIISSLKELDSNLFSIYPNPVENILSVKFTDFKNATVSLYNLNGKVIFQENFNSNIEINTSNIGAGIYILKLETARGNTHKKIQITK